MEAETDKFYPIETTGPVFEIDPKSICEGHRLTVLEWVGVKDNSYVGDVFGVVSVCLPFVAAARLSGLYGVGQMHSFDTRRVKLGVVSAAYAHAMTLNPN